MNLVLLVWAFLASISLAISGVLLIIHGCTDKNRGQTNSYLIIYFVVSFILVLVPLMAMGFDFLSKIF